MAVTDGELFQAARKGDLEVLRAHRERLTQELEAYPYSVWAAAIEADRLEALALCLEEGLDPNGTPQSRPLIQAISWKAQRCVSLLIDAGADLALRDEEGRSPLLMGVMNRSEEVVRASLAAGANPFEEALILFFQSAPKPIQNLIRTRRKELTEAFGPLVEAHKLLEKGADPGPITVAQASTPIPMKKGVTLLHVAARRGRSDFLAKQLQQGADPNLLDEAQRERKYGQGTTLQLSAVFGGRTLLMEAAEAGQAEAVAVLLESGADPMLRDSHGETALHLASRTPSLALVHRLLGAGADPGAVTVEGGTPLLLAGYFGDPAVAEALIDAGAPLDQPDEQGFTPLLAACYEGRTEVVKVLLARGARLDQDAGEEGDIWDALHIGRRTKTLKLLLPRLDVNPPGRTSSPLAAAAEWSHIDAIPALVKAGARLLPGEHPRVVSAWGGSPAAKEKALRALGRIGWLPDEEDLRTAVWQDDESLVRLLVELGADPTLGLHHAASAEQIDLLVELGAEINRLDSEGSTPLLAAVQQGRADVAKRLLSKGADPSLPDARGVRPADAAQLGDGDMKKVFKGIPHDKAKTASLRLVQMFSDYTPPEVKDVRAALEDGGDPNGVVGRGIPLLAAAAGWRQWELADLLASRGAKATWESDLLLAVRGLPEAARSEAFLADVRRAEEELEEKAVPVGDGYGSVTFGLKARVSAREALLVSQGENAVAAGFAAGLQTAAETAEHIRPLMRSCWCGGWRGHPVANPQLLLVPTRDPYLVVALIQPRAGEHEIGVMEILEFLRRYEDLGWELTGIGYDTVDLEFSRLPPDLDAWCQELYAFCPDLIDQGHPDLPSLAAHLRTTGQLHLWWD